MSKQLSSLSSLALVLAFLVSGCRVGPDYHRPEVETPVDWHWKKAALQDVAQSGPAWQVFNDPVLNDLETLAIDANEDIKAAVGRVEEARALARVSRADMFPQISAQPGFSRSEQSANGFTPGFSGTIPGIRAPFNAFNVPLDLSYEADVWGRIRRSISASRDRAYASVADYHTVLLTVTSDVAANYFLLRALDADVDVLEHTLALRGESLKLVNNQFKFGVVDALDVNRAKTDLSSAEAALANVRRQREEVVHVLAILCGKPASGFKVEFKPLATTPPEVPAGLPSELLQRRPDVVRAEYLLAASSEEIGVAKAAYFPRLSLTSSAGFESEELSKLFNWPSTAWSFAANIIQPVFTGGRNRANLEAAKARYEQALAIYRQQILVAFKDVEDALVDIKYRGEQAKALNDAVEAARTVTKLAMTRYQNGQVSFLDVVDAQRQQLLVEEQAVLVLGERQTATVRLIKALGGGWDVNCGLSLNATEVAPIPNAAPVPTAPQDNVPPPPPQPPAGVFAPAPGPAAPPPQPAQTPPAPGPKP
jgi:multidrug efflux system outer membrane protein